MITEQSVKLLLDAIMPPSLNRRVWLGKIPRKFQLAYLGHDFGQVTLKLEEGSESILELRKSRNGYIDFNGVKYEVRAKYNLLRPNQSKFDKASPLARKAIISLMNEHNQRQIKPSTLTN